jgi:diguanylate cyclase (GGDEF)-like protein
MTPEEELAFLRAQVIELQMKLNTDEVTGAGSRRGLEAHIESLKLEALRASKIGKHAMLYLDGDGFKKINDQYGHAGGDAVIQDMAQKLMKRFRRREAQPSDFIARLGGDEFVVILYNCSAQDALNRAKEVQDLLATSCVYNGQEIHYTCTVGCAMYHTNEDWRAALDRADSNMYRAKKARHDAAKSNVVDFKPR